MRDGFKSSIGYTGVLIDSQRQQKVEARLKVLAEKICYPAWLPKMLAEKLTTVLKCVSQDKMGGIREKGRVERSLAHSLENFNLTLNQDSGIIYQRNQFL